MILLKNPADCQIISTWQADSIALVPTMGNLHAGHLSLVKAAQANCDKVIVSIFVNPTQFGPNEDFDSYPRTIEDDLSKLEALGIDAVLLPTADWLYPLGQQCIRVCHTTLNDKLCGHSRPGFFDGICTAVLKLFTSTFPSHIILGEKDRQQLMIIEQMAADLLLPVQIIGVPIVREEDGLAMSSRNQYLTEQEREIGPQLYQTLLEMQQAAQTTGDLRKIEQAGIDTLSQLGFEIDYLTFCDPITLDPAQQTPCVLFAAAMLGKTRLIDNLVVAPNQEG